MSAMQIHWMFGMSYKTARSMGSCSWTRYAKDQLHNWHLIPAPAQ
jgi:hypothetical protein